tara:strand:+ start:1342 stop:1890 length:549 start_codon:yes stop_codon:yes gene_type:complete
MKIIFIVAFLHIIVCYPTNNKLESSMPDVFCTDACNIENFWPDLEDPTWLISVNNDGICDDTPPCESCDPLCDYGTDCSDCGIRYFEEENSKSSNTSLDSLNENHNTKRPLPSPSLELPKSYNDEILLFSESQASPSPFPSQLLHAAALTGKSRDTKKNQKDQRFYTKFVYIPHFLRSFIFF